jgi:hypothetical protein
VKKQEAKFQKNLLDFAIILLSGIFGFIAVHIFPNKFFD